MKLEGKKALVTGASRGIGRAIALALAAEGADVVVNYAGSEAAAKEVAAEIEAMGRKAFVVQADISSNEAATAMVDEVVKEFGRIDILVNNAGITRDGLLMRMKEEDWDAVLTTNLKGVFNCTKAAIKYMMKQKAGKIVSISSVVGLMGNAGQANYAASKAGLIALAKSIAQEMGPKGIRANAIAPGFIDTAMTQALSDEVRKEWAAKIPLRRGGTVDDIAACATFLASDMSSYISGQVIQVDGGMNM